MSLPNAKEIALRRVDAIRDGLNGQPVTDLYLAQKAAEYVGVTTGAVLKWIRERRP